MERFNIPRASRRLCFSTGLEVFFLRNLGMGKHPRQGDGVSTLHKRTGLPMATVLFALVE